MTETYPVFDPLVGDVNVLLDLARRGDLRQKNSSALPEFSFLHMH
jgi:hypothetical protein